jgi:hypothetical protein
MKPSLPMDEQKLALLVREIGWSHNFIKHLPKELKGQLPGPEEIARLLEYGGGTGWQRCWRRFRMALGS